MRRKQTAVGLAGMLLWLGLAGCQRAAEAPAETGAALTEKLVTLCAEFAVHFASKT